jgi:hypothetical protein
MIIAIMTFFGAAIPLGLGGVVVYAASKGKKANAEVLESRRKRQERAWETYKGEGRKL